MRNIKYAFAALIFTVFAASCSDLFETESSSVAFEEDNRLDSPNDSLYSVMGLLSQLQRVGERYLLLGELRGDLMQATNDAPADMQELSALSLSADNVYASKKDYYAIINNCNYAISRMDTTITVFQERVMVPEYAQIKAIRAWAYWQVALAYGEACWIEQPILTLEASLKDYPTIDMEQLARRLVEDLLPYTDTRALNYGTVDGYYSSRMFFPIRVLLGDMYLFLNRYQEAADMYYAYIEKQKLTLTSNYASNWTRNTRQLAEMSHAASYSDEWIVGFTYSSDPKEYHPQLIRWTYNDVPSVVPANNFVESMSRSMYFYAEPNAVQISGYFEGDLRGKAVSSVGTVTADAYGDMQLTGYNGSIITKYMKTAAASASGHDPENNALKQLTFTRLLPVYRTPHLYLRFAEALNRLGKPTMAFAVLKYGLNKETMEDTTKVNSSERRGEVYTDFSGSWCNGNVGTASRGRGRGVPLDREFYVIPDYTRYVTVTDDATGREITMASQEASDVAAAQADSILFVENCIVDEMAAETAFEGNRFFDLLRVARHRGDYPGYMAGMVSNRFENVQTVKERLMDEQVWYFK